MTQNNPQPVIISAARNAIRTVPGQPVLPDCSAVRRGGGESCS